MSSLSYDVVVIGGGAAGLFCAAQSAKYGKKVALIEHNQELGKKILISGGGRCNFTNLNVSAADFYCENPHFVKSALNQFSNQDFIDLVQSEKIEYYEKKLGQLFCVNSAKDILNLLTKLCEQSSVDVFLSTSVNEIKKDQTFILKASQHNFRCEQLVIATGGPAVKKIGASLFGHQVAKQFNHSITPMQPALVPIICNELTELSGISLPVEVKVDKRLIKDDILFTHKGLSGPAILKASLFLEKGKSFYINFLPDISEFPKKGMIKKFLKDFVPKRLSEKLLAGFIRENFEHCSDDDLARLKSLIHCFEFVVKEFEHMDKAEATRGGVSVEHISSKNMESKLVPNLYFIGEVLDVTGLLGGYNFQWAWSSGWVAGNDIALKA